MRLLSRLLIVLPLLLLLGCDQDPKSLQAIAQEREISIPACVTNAPHTTQPYTKASPTHTDTTPPELTFYGDNPLTLQQGESYQRECALGIDETDGQVTVYIDDTQVDTSRVGEYTILFSAVDLAGNLAHLERIVRILPNLPMLTLIGDQNLTLIEGACYRERGASAYDLEDGNLTSQVIISGEVNTSQVGRTLLRYDVNDSEGNPAHSLYRSVEVLPAPTYRYGGSVTGLEGNESVIVIDEAGDSLTLTSNTSFAFLQRLHSQEHYGISLTVSPLGKECTLLNASGTIADDNVTDITISCHPIPFTIQCRAVRDANPDHNESDFTIDLNSTQTHQQLLTLDQDQNPMRFKDSWYYHDAYELFITRVKSDYPYFDFKQDGILSPHLTGEMPPHDLNLTLVPTYRIHGDASGSNTGDYKYTIQNHANRSDVTIDGGESSYQIAYPVEYNEEFNLTLFTPEDAPHGECTFMDTSSTAFEGVMDENIDTIDIECYE